VISRGLMLLDGGSTRRWREEVIMTVAQNRVSPSGLFQEDIPFT